MDENLPPPKHRRWRWIILAIPAGAAFVVFAVFKALSTLNAIRPEQVQAPREIYHVAEITSGTAAAKISKLAFGPGSTTKFEDLIADRPNTALAIYAKWSPRFKDRDTFAEPLKNWNPGQPLTPQQLQWLLDQREFIDDMILMGLSGGIPMLTGDQIAGLDYKQHMSMPQPNYAFYHHAAKIVAAESQRRRAAGDMPGAIDALVSIYRNAMPLREPTPVGLFWANWVQGCASLELKSWIEAGPIEPRYARELRDRISPNTIRLDHFKRVAEIESYFNRDELVKSLAGPFLDLLRYNMVRTTREFKPDENHQFKTFISALGFLANGADTSVAMKSNAAREIEKFDDEVRRRLRSFASNQLTDEYNRETPNNYDFYWRRQTRMIAAMTQMDLAALDMATSGTVTSRIDPFQNKPFKVVEKTSGTLIYSLGPDLKDQAGAVIYDASKGLTSAGDIVLRIPKKNN